MANTPHPFNPGSMAYTGALIGTELIDVNVGPVRAACTSAQLAATPVAPLAGGASKTLTTANADTVTKLDTAAGTVITLPAATGSGNYFKFVVTTTTTSGAHKILAASSSDNLIGFVTGQNANTAKCFQATAADTFHSLQMPFSGSQPSGGLEGDWFIFEDVAANTWHVRGCYSAGTTPTTPFSTATS